MLEKYYSHDMSVAAYHCGTDKNGKSVFCVIYRNPYHFGGYLHDECYEAHEIKLYKWARHLHGNAPSGTPYGYIRASRNGKRIIITV